MDRAVQRCQLGEARRALDQASADLPASSHPLLSAVRALVAARVDLAENRPDRAIGTLRDACGASVLPVLPPSLVRRLMLTTAEAQVAAGEPDQAGNVALRAGGAHLVDSAIVLAQAQLTAGQAALARQTVRSATTDTVALRNELRVASWLLEAQSSYALGDVSPRWAMSHAAAGRWTGRCDSATGSSCGCPSRCWDPG